MESSRVDPSLGRSDAVSKRHKEKETCHESTQPPPSVYLLTTQEVDGYISMFQYSSAWDLPLIQVFRAAFFIGTVGTSCNLLPCPHLSDLRATVQSVTRVQEVLAQLVGGDLAKMGPAGPGSDAAAGAAIAALMRQMVIIKVGTNQLQ
ncbi:hypothetical protein TcWFU_003787 [Taenia crassiceps]|uniref:Uncharacterized protein n=1 Tax=Taenia crassiceps TaxID=6207 RepID=A0ABR4Q883_9CEST